MHHACNYCNGIANFIPYNNVKQHEFKFSLLVVKKVIGIIYKLNFPQNKMPNWLHACIPGWLAAWLYCVNVLHMHAFFKLGDQEVELRVSMGSSTVSGFDIHNDARYKYVHNSKVYVYRMQCRVYQYE